MNRKIGRNPANHPADSNILNDGGIHPGRNDRAQIMFRLLDFIWKNQSVESDIGSNASKMQKAHQLRKICFREVMRAHPGVEFLESKINSVRAVLDRGTNTFPIA